MTAAVGASAVVVGLVFGKDGPQVPLAWEAPRFPDSCSDVNLCCELPIQVLVVDFLRRPVPERGVEPDPIIAKLDVPRNIVHRPFPCRIRGAVDPLDFQ